MNLVEALCQTARRSTAPHYASRLYAVRHHEKYAANAFSMYHVSLTLSMLSSIKNGPDHLSVSGPHALACSAARNSTWRFFAPHSDPIAL